MYLDSIIKKEGTRIKMNYPREINKDDCPEQDNVLYPHQCDGCTYYEGFEMIKGKRCIYCNYLGKKDYVKDSNFDSTNGE